MSTRAIREMCREQDVGRMHADMDIRDSGTEATIYPNGVWRKVTGLALPGVWWILSSTQRGVGESLKRLNSGDIVDNTNIIIDMDGHLRPLS